MATPEEMREWAAKKMGWHEHNDIWWISNDYQTHLSVAMDVFTWRPDNPTTGQIWMLVEKMRELGLYLTIYTDINSYTAVFRTVDSSGRFWSAPLEINPCHAIILSAMATEEK